MDSQRRCVQGLLSLILFALLLLVLAPERAAAASRAQKLTAGRATTCVGTNEGTAGCTGSNASGQLGNGTTTDSSTPVPVQNQSDVTAIDTGDGHTCAVTGEGKAGCWGSNASGQLGDGTTTDHSTPAPVPSLTNVTAISTASFHTCALKNDGTVWSWGSNALGQLGVGTTDDHSTPAPVPSLTNVTAISIAGHESCALKSDGTVWCWGSNFVGELGNGETGTFSTTPVRVLNLSGVIAISVGEGSVCAVKNDGTVWCWGSNVFGQLGDGTTDDHSTPVLVKNLTGVIAITTGGTHTCALKSDGTVWCWGRNDHGQLGDGTTTDSTTPVQVKNLSGVTAISAGEGHTCALTGDGKVWCWGDNEFGQLGNGESGVGAHSVVPVQMGWDHFPPSAPIDLVVTVPSATQIQLTWQDEFGENPGEVHVERSPNETSGWTEIATVTGLPTYTDTTPLACGATYYYRVRRYRSSDGQFSIYTKAASVQACTVTTNKLFLPLVVR